VTDDRPARIRRVPSWLWVVLIWVASRAFTTVVLVVFARSEGRTFWAGPNPNYFQLAEFWDSGWYHQIALSGYPSVLPLSASGQVRDNSWAFLPAYPELVRALTAVSGIPWDVLAIVVSLVFSLAGALMFHRLMRQVLAPGSALFAVLLLSIAPLSAIMQVAYAESMALFFLTLALYLLVRRRYLWMLPVVAILDLTRPIGPPFALLMLAHLGYRWFTRLRDPFSRSARYRVILVTAFSLVMAAAWPAIAWVVTGSPAAYLDSELAWRAHALGPGSTLLFQAWFGALGRADSPMFFGGILAAMIGFVALLMFSRSVRQLGPDLRMWLGGYALYLVAVFFPQASTIRLLMPMSPLLGAAAVPRSRIWRAALVVGSLALQCLWIWFAWFDHGGGIWSPP
jgi:hypothetical protein